MSRDDGNDALRNAWFEMGTITGLRQAADIALKEAAERFSMDKDVEADLLRKLARGLTLTADNRQALHDQRYPKTGAAHDKGTPRLGTACCDLDVDCARLRAEVAERTEERDNAQANAERLGVEKNELRTENAELRTRLEATGGTYDRLTAEIAELHAERRTDIRQLEEIRSLSMDLEETCAKQAAEITRRKAEVAKQAAEIAELRAQLEARALAPERTEADVERAVQSERSLHVETFEMLHARYEALAAQSRTQGKMIEGLEVACKNLREAFGSRPYDVLAAKVERETWFMLRGVWQGRITRLSTDCDVLRGALRDAGDAANQWRRDAEWFTRERDEARADLGSALAGIEDEKRALLGRLEAARAAACVASGYPKEEILVAIHRLRGQLQNALSVRNVQGVTLVAVEKELGSYVDRTGPEGWNAEVFLVDAIRQLKNALSISNDEIEVKRKKIGTLHDLLDTAEKETERVRADYTDLRARVDGVLRSVRAGAPTADAAGVKPSAKGETK